MSYAKLRDGAEIYYEIFGSGLPVVFLHGAGVDAHYMKNAFLPLAGTDFKLVFFDFRGNGKSSHRPIDSDFSIESLAADVEDLREKLELDKIFLYGHSFGGVIAQEYAARFPENLRALILDDTFPSFGAEMFANLERRASPEELRLFIEAFGSPAPDDETFARTFNTVLPVYFHNFDEQKVISLFAEMRFSAAAFNRSAELMPGINTTEKLSSVKVPTLVIAGRHDLYGLDKTAELMSAKIPNSKLVIFEESGHYPFLEETEKCLQAIKEFFNTTLV